MLNENEIPAVPILRPPEIKVRPKRPDRKPKILWYSDFLKPTGFGNVAEALISRLIKTGKYDIEVLGINYHGEPYNRPESPYYHLKDVPVYPAMFLGNEKSAPDMIGRQKLLNLLMRGEYDILFILQDLFNISPMREALETVKKRTNLKYTLYFPVDGDLDPEWLSETLPIADVPIVYTNYGKEQIIAQKHRMQKAFDLNKLKVLYHGVDLSVFRPLDDKERREVRKNFINGLDDETLVIINVNRNQPRKDIVRTIEVYKRFKQKIEELYAKGEGKYKTAKLYLHCFPNDSAGINLPNYIEKYYPELREDINFPDIAMLNQEGGYSAEIMNGLYNASDMLISTTLGEGWGLATTEAMAAGIPVIIPNNTTAKEIIGENEERGFLANSNTDGSMWYVQKYDNDLKRPLTDIDHMIEKMLLVTKDEALVASKTLAAREWLEKNANWDDLAKEWEKIFDGLFDSRWS